MEIKIEIELEIEELRTIIKALQGITRLESAPKIATSTPSSNEPEQAMTAETECEFQDDLAVEHDCLEEVEFEVIEDWGCAFTVVKCEICGRDVSGTVRRHVRGR